MFLRSFLLLLLCGFMTISAKKDHGDFMLNDGSWQGKSYCAIRPVQTCCPGRDDMCTVPFFDTVCYCDMFCNRTISDCCPDFLGHCFGGPGGGGGGNGNGGGPQELKSTEKPGFKNNCYHEGKLHNIDDMITVNCNNCTCVYAIIKDEYNWKCTQKICLIRPELLHYVNANATKLGWTASNYSAFWGLTLDEGVRRRLGTHQPTEHITKMSVLKVTPDEKPPHEFDARKQWPGLISPVLDQMDCAGSWAFSTTGVASDRLHIHSSGFYKQNLSPQHLISCHGTHEQHGCKSGHIDRAWWFIRKIGVVADDCFAYKSGKSGEAGSCPLPKLYESLKHSSCPQKSVPIKVFQATPPYRIAPNELVIMKEIMDNGPLQVVMEVKEDFFMYRNGVYRHSLPADYLTPNQKQSNFHSVRLIGWGTDTSTGHPFKYWLCANSWGKDWGEDGYFRILRGTDESSIESYVVGAWVKVDERTLVERRHKPAKHDQFLENNGLDTPD